MSAPLANLDLVARFGVAARELGVDVGGVAQAMPLLGEQLADAEVGFCTDGSSLAIATTAPVDRAWGERIGKLAQLLGADPGPVDRLLHGRPARAIRLELASTPKPAGLAATLRWIGDGTIDDDATLFVASGVLSGVSESVRAVLVDRAQFLAQDPAARGQTAAFTLRYALGEETEVGVAIRLSSAEADLPDAMGRVEAIQKEIGIGPQQRTLFERMHPLLGLGKVALVELSGSAREMLPRTTIRWAAASWDEAMRVASGLARDGATRTGKFSGSFASAEPTSIAVGFCPTDPPPAWIWARP
ncbi:MAG TPA: hypothetical protein VGM88_21585 [Kofleriaceae bacterium]